MALVSAGLTSAVAARAEPSTWFYAGAGAADLNFRPEEYPMLIQLETGLGSPAKHGFVVGGLFQFHGYLANGSDLGAALRFTHASFVLGDWGAGLDLGFYQRWWGGNSTGGSGRLVLGAPLGITASIGGTMGSNDQRIVSATLGIDFARLSVHRSTLLDWWHNPFPPETGDAPSASTTPDWRF
ncbi:MAG TPA: hypothetical protein VI197_23020 [Polyangiaceae bacterium]